MATSSFNAKTGAFASADGGSYWSQVGRQSDREGRQMAGEASDAGSSSLLSLG